MIKIIDVEKIKEYKRDDNSIYCLSVKILLSNGESNIVDFFGQTIEEARDNLCNITWKDEIIAELNRTIDDCEDEVYWKGLLNKITKNEALSEDDYESINFVMTTGTVFKEFNYVKWVL